MAVWNVINHQELSGSATTVTHSSIAGSYDHLHGIISARSDQSAYYSGIMLNFNDDTGSNYSFTDVHLLLFRLVIKQKLVTLLFLLVVL